MLTLFNMFNILIIRKEGICQKIMSGKIGEYEIFPLRCGCGLRAGARCRGKQSWKD